MTTDEEATEQDETIANLRVELDHKDTVIANLITAMRRASVADVIQAVRILREALDGPDAADTPPHQETLL